MEESPTLCLNMIVKNESKIITRLLESVLSIIDCYCICDTGSTDNTIEIIYKYFASKNIPGKIVYEPFKNFAHNRNFAIKSCKGMSDYILLMDADMVLQIHHFNKSMLNLSNSFSIFQGHDNFYYKNCRIIKNDGLKKYVGVTHECLDSDNVYTIKKSDLFILDIGDGGCKQNKFERDIQLLTDGLVNEPNNCRYYFYLANSYRDIKEYQKAIEMYEKRIQYGGWEQEVWYSYYSIGTCYLKLNKNSDAIFAWLNGYNYFPRRIENLYEIVRYYRIIGKYKLSYHFYNLANNIKNENLDIDNYLFLHKHVYNYNLDYEFSLIACYNGIHNINDNIVSILNNSKNLSINSNLLSNLKYYKDILKPIQILNLDETKYFDINGENIKFYYSSSCLIHNSNNNGYLMNIRYVNYYINEKGSYIKHNNIISINRFVELDKELKIVNDKYFDNIFDNRRYIGIEDIRIFNSSSSSTNIKFIGTGYHKNNYIGIVEGEYNVDKSILEFKEIICGFKNSICEKNWVFTDYNGSTHVIYHWFPLQICKIDEETQQLNLIESKNMPNIFSIVYGSSCGFKYINNNQPELWFILHICSDEAFTYYYHMIAIFDENMNLLRYSAPLKFEGDSIEYSLSIVVEKDRVLINYSGWDRTTRIGIYDKQYIDSLIKYN